MSMPQSSVCVFIPSLRDVFFQPLNENGRVDVLLLTIWQKMRISLDRQGVDLAQLSLRSLRCPVPVVPRHTIRRRVEDSARDNGCITPLSIEKVFPCWCDPENVHVYLHIDPVPPSPEVAEIMRVARKLHDNVWGQDLNPELRDVPGESTLKYLPNAYLDSLELRVLGYTEKCLLIRAEYDVAFGDFNPQAAISRMCDGVVVTGQPGIGKSCFLYYVLLRLLSRRSPVALQVPGHFLVFGFDGVEIHPLDQANYNVFPAGTCALSDSNEEVKAPCSAFLGAAKQGRAWIVQATSPLEERWRMWKKQRSADIFVMDHPTVDEIESLGKILGLDLENIKRYYETWGPSARIYLDLSRNPHREHAHEMLVIDAATDFVSRLTATTTGYNAIKVSHILFSVRPESKTPAGRMIPVADAATERIEAIISYAVATAHASERIAFYSTLSRHSWFKAFAGHMFEKFVLTWLSSDHCGLDPLLCTPANIRPRGLKVDQLPFCLLPRPQSRTLVDAVVITDTFIITIQVAISPWRRVRQGLFAEIEANLPTITNGRKKRRWCHAYWLRARTLSDLPSHFCVYSAVFSVDRPGITSERMRKLDNEWISVESTSTRQADNQKRLDLTQSRVPQLSYFQQKKIQLRSSPNGFRPWLHEIMRFFKAFDGAS
ncbi:hypothetical protein EDB85DRAFT_1992850 [Lactarius pseudohatsudake]|nr:hypothetical protein EDB85DRAFT_1992850 [Lactarius pseudohatsudake]